MLRSQKSAEVLTKSLAVSWHLTHGLGVDGEKGAGVHHKLQGRALTLPVPAVTESGGFMAGGYASDMGLKFEFCRVFLLPRKIDATINLT